MEFTVRQFLAWVLIVIGLGIVFWDISSSYYYFTAQKEFPKVFTENQSVNSSNSGSSTGIEGQIGNVIKDQIKQMIPENTVTQVLNMSSWIVFASFLLWAGGKLIGIGNNFLKES